MRRLVGVISSLLRQRFQSLVSSCFAWDEFFVWFCNSYYFVIYYSLDYFYLFIPPNPPTYTTLCNHIDGQARNKYIPMPLLVDSFSSSGPSISNRRCGNESSNEMTQQLQEEEFIQTESNKKMERKGMEFIGSIRMYLNGEYICCIGIIKRRTLTTTTAQQEL